MVCNFNFGIDKFMRCYHKNYGSVQKLFNRTNEMVKKSNFVIIDKDGVKHSLIAVNSVDEEINQVVIVKESATGNGGISYANGRLQESIPLNGILHGNTFEELERQKKWLKRLARNGETITFKYPFSSNEESSTKYIIKNLKFHYSHETGVNTSSFSCILTEKREYNTKRSAVNLVNFGYANFLIDYYSKVTEETL